MTERKVIKVKRQAIRRARLKKVGTVAAMLPLVMSKGAPVATLFVVDMAKQHSVSNKLSKGQSKKSPMWCYPKHLLRKCWKKKNTEV